MMYTRMKEIAMLFRASVLAYDYSGYGKSSGKIRTSVFGRRNNETCLALCWPNLNTIVRGSRNTFLQRRGFGAELLLEYRSSI